MNIYSKKSRWKIVLLASALSIGLGSLFYTNNLVDKLAEEEGKKVELWALAMKRFVIDNETSTLTLQVMQNNETIPVILMDDAENIITYRNLDSLKIQKPKYLEKTLRDMKSYAEPIVVPISKDDIQYLYYTKSILLKKLTYYPYVQLAAIFIFVVVAYLAFSSSRKAEQNQVWVGLSKETAHQLGTPISSLLAWTEILSSTENDEIISEFKKDVHRLEKITERFSKIGSQPKLTDQNLSEITNNALNYMRSRVSEKVTIDYVNSEESAIKVPLNKELFEWVIENLCKNAIDAMEGTGQIKVSLQKQNDSKILIDIEDNGKGIAKNKLKTIFKPGYTTKQRGWGLGLSLARRIIEDYHRGKIFVLQSDLGKGTTFRIILNKSLN